MMKHNKKPSIEDVHWIVQQLCSVNGRENIQTPATISDETPIPARVLVKHLLRHKDLVVRAEAAHRLGDLRDNTFIEPLREALYDQARFVRAEAARALGKLGKQVPIDPLLALLKDPDGSVRVAAVQALGMQAERAPLENLERALKDRWPPVREAAVLALGKLGERVSPETFLASLQDKDEFVRAAALSTLGTTGKNAPSEPSVEDYVEQTPTKHYNPVKSFANRLFLWPATSFSHLDIPDWVKQNKITLIIAVMILFFYVLFTQKSRLLPNPKSLDPATLSEKDLGKQA
jgi:HEAT repeat protein